MPWSPRKCALVPFDFSSHSLRAVELALEICSDPSHVHVLHVLPYLIPAEPGVIWADIDDSQRIEHARQALVRELSDSKYSAVVKEVVVGDAGQACADRAQQLEADIIVIPSHGRTGISRLLLGSVAERVLRLAKCPVLVIKL